MTSLMRELNGETTTRHLAARVAPWLGLALVVGLGLPALYLTAIQPPGVPASQSNGLLLASVIGLAELCFAAVGSLVMRRQPANAVGPLLMLCAVCFALAGLTGQVVIDAYFSGFRPPWLAPVAVVDNLAGTISLFSIFPILLLVFPDGHALSPRWRWFAIEGVCGVICGSAGRRERSAAS